MSSIADEIIRQAARIDALQRGFTSNRDERAIAEIILSVSGAALTALKNAIDVGEDYHTLHQLFYHDIEDDGIRDQLFAHVGAHGAPIGSLKVLSDIDDTLFRNWVDPRYPDKTVYPGVRALYRELSVGAEERGREDELVFVTARPYDRLGLTDRVTRSTLHQNGVMRSTVLAGDFLHLLTNELIAEQKHKRFLEFAPLYPEYGYVFLGDSGQGDVLAGRKMLEHGAVRAVFIHDVVPTPEAERQAQRAHRVYFHDTYVGAATQAHALGLIGRAGLLRVARAALAELAAIRFDNAAQREAILRFFDRDVAALNQHLPAEDRLTP